jgi:hypothetical protein
MSCTQELKKALSTTLPQTTQFDIQSSPNLYSQASKSNELVVCWTVLLDTAEIVFTVFESGSEADRKALTSTYNRWFALGLSEMGGKYMNLLLFSPAYLFA